MEEDQQNARMDVKTAQKVGRLKIKTRGPGEKNAGEQNPAKRPDGPKNPSENRPGRK